DAVVAKALAPNPADRYARADDFARALNEALVRSGKTVGAEEVGDYVRANCPDDYAKNRKLISGLSSVRVKQQAPTSVQRSPRPPATPSPSTQPEIGFDATRVRSSTEALPPGASQIIPGRRGPLPLLLGAAVIIGLS